MRNQRKIEVFIYRSFDWIAAVIAWFVFFSYRKYVEKKSFDFYSVIEDPQLLKGLIIIPVAWLILYALFDKYADIYRYSRFATLRRTFLLSFFGVITIFFIILKDDEIWAYTSFIRPFVILLGLHFGITALFRILLLTLAKHRLKSGKIAYNTLIIGSGKSAVYLFDELKQSRNHYGHRFIGYLDSGSSSNDLFGNRLIKLGSTVNLMQIIKDNAIEDVIIAMEKENLGQMKSIINRLYDSTNPLTIKVLPNMYDILLGKVKMNHVFGAALIEIDQELMPKWALLAKRIIDLVVSCLGMLFLSPLLLFSAFKVKLSSEGPIVHSQERIGKNGRTFRIYKFRSMYIDAEKYGPQLSQDDDPRITPWGKIMRKYRIDELLNFVNVIKGDMSLVGPRPERQFYIDQIMKVAPHYRHLLKVRPGITSWGQVKYGYASNIEEMVQRLKYDMIYLENMSLSLDFKIIAYTVMVLFYGKGK